MNKPHLPTVAISSEGDILILRGSRQAALVFYASDDACSTDSISGIVVNNPTALKVFETMLAAAAKFSVMRAKRPPSARAETLCISFELPQGGKIGFTSEKLDTKRDLQWFTKQGYTIIASAPLTPQKHE